MKQKLESNTKPSLKRIFNQSVFLTFFVWRNEQRERECLFWSQSYKRNLVFKKSKLIVKLPQLSLTITKLLQLELR